MVYRQSRRNFSSPIDSPIPNSTSGLPLAKNSPTAKIKNVNTFFIFAVGEFFAIVTHENGNSFGCQLAELTKSGVTNR